ncbi:MAG: LVIVD repeat-containing protein, partial [bacterium]
MFSLRIKTQKLTLRIGLIALFLFYFKGYSHSQINLGLVGTLKFSDYIECLEVHKDHGEHNIYNNIYAFCGTGRGLTIINVTDPDSPEIVTQLDLGKIVAIEFFEIHDGPNNGSKDFVVILNTRNDLVFLCIEDPERPGFAGRYSLLRRPDAPLVINKQDLVVSGEYLYVADGFAGLDIIDISDPYEPQYAGRVDTPGKAQGIYIEGDYAYVADGPDGFVIIDISNPTDPFYVSGLNLTKLKVSSKPTVGTKDIVVKGPYAYLVCDDFGLFVFDITDKAGPFQKNEYNLAGNNTNIDASHINLATFDNYAYMAHYDGLTIIDMNDPNDGGKYIDLQSGAYDVAICEDYAYVVDFGKEEITIFRIQDPISPEPRGNLLVVGDAQRIVLHNEYAYILDIKRGMLEISINDVSKPELEAICLSNKVIKDISIHGDIAYVSAEKKGIALIDLKDSSKPARYYNNNISKAVSIAVDEDGRYAYVADNIQGIKRIVVLDISNLDINDSQKPLFVGSFDTEGGPTRIKVQGNYIYVCEKDKGLEIFDINTPDSPERTGILKTFKDNEVEKNLANAVDIEISGNYAYLAAKDDGVIIADISDPYNPVFLNSYDSQFARGIEISYPYAYIADDITGVVALDITNPCMPLPAEDVKKTGISFKGMDLQIKGEYLYVAARHDGLIIFRILDTPPLQGNIILCTGGPFSSVNPLWPPSQALSNKIFSVFKDASYPNYFVYYFNPNPFQDLDGDRFLDPFIVDDFDPMQGDLKFSLTNWAGTRLNTGPLYLYLTGLGTEDAFMISPGEIVKASDPYDPNNMNTLKQFLDTFQKANPGRDVICLLEFASSGSLCDDLIDSNTIPYSRTVITCTDTETSYLDPNGRNAFTSHLITLLQDSGQEGLFANTGIYSHQRVGLLQGLFSQARKDFWAQGYPFNTQPPKMVSARGAHTLCSLSLSVDPVASHVSDPDIPIISSTYPDHALAFIPTGHYPDGDFVLDPGDVYFQSSDPSILLVTEEGLAFANPNTNFNGNATVLATIIDPNFTQAQCNDTDNPLGGVTGCIRVNVKIPGREEKESLPMAIIVAGEKEEGDYLWEETHTIANYAYTTFLSRGYSRENIIYLTHYIEETEGNEDTDLDGDGDPDNDIDGVPNLHNLREALDLVEEKGAKKLILFMVDHGIKKGDNLSPEGGFFLSSPDKDPNDPQKDSNSILNPLELDHWLDILQGRIKDLEITIIVESCHSGLFIDPLKGEKRVIITSTMEDESFLYANGLVSFSYYLFSLLQSGASMTTAYNGALYSLLEIDRFLHTQREALNEPHQKPQLWSQPKSLAHSTAIGGPFLISQDQPIISSSRIVPDPNDSAYDPNTIKTGQDVLISVEASDMDGIDEVWAMVNATYNLSVPSGDYDHP